MIGLGVRLVFEDLDCLFLFSGEWVLISGRSNGLIMFQGWYFFMFFILDY